MTTPTRSAMSRLAPTALALALAAVAGMAPAAVASTLDRASGDGMPVDVSAGEYLNRPDIGPVRTTPWMESHIHHGLGCTIVLVPDDPTRAPQVLVDDPRVCD